MANDKHTIQIEIDPIVNIKKFKDKVESELKELKQIQSKLEIQIGTKQTLKQTLSSQIKSKESEVKLAIKQYESGLKSKEKETKIRQAIEAKEKKVKEAREKKHYNFREKVEKYRLSETKKLMKQGMTFEKARKTAFTKSLMSAKDLRDLEYKELQENKKATKSSFMKNMFKASFLGNLGAAAVSKGAGSIFGFVMDSVFKKSEDIRSRKTVGVTYSEKERLNIQRSLLGTKTRQHAFATEREQLDFLKATSRFKSEIMGIRGLTGTEKYQRQALELTADLVGRYVTDLGTASQAVESAIKGEFGDLFNILKVAMGNERKLSAEQLEYFSNMQVQDPLARFKKIEEILNMVQSINKEGATKFDETGASFRRLLDEIQTIIANASEPILMGIKMLIEFFRDPVTSMTSFFSALFEKITGLISQSMATVFSKVKDVAGYLNPTSWFKWMWGGGE